MTAFRYGGDRRSVVEGKKTVWSIQGLEGEEGRIAMADLAGCHIVVTGGTGALGRAVVSVLRAGGATCHVPNLVAAELEDFPYRADPGVQIVRDVDLADEAAARRFYRQIPALWASVHLAGGFAMAPISETSTGDFIGQWRLNALTSFLCSTAAVAAIRARGAPGPGGAKGGRIVNMAARPALEPRLGAGMVAYTAAKSAVAALTQALAQELAEEEIWVNAIAPSILDTPANRAAMPHADPANWVPPEAVALLIADLLSPQNRAIRGAVIPVYGRS
jgi:NAD(P)-dependent dehydrogenase (short-subunit alcohol dehydrogenase family)